MAGETNQRPLAGSAQVLADPLRADQVAVVTGGSAGLGLAIAGVLARAGSAAVVLASRSAQRCEDAAAALSEETGCVVQGYACDVTDEQAVAGLTDRVLAEHGRLDVLVTSAGMPARSAWSAPRTGPATRRARAPSCNSPAAWPSNWRGQGSR